MTTTLRNVAERFDAIGLADLGDAALMHRVDRKFTVPVGSLSALLGQAIGEYRILDVGGVRLNRYSTKYFDTPELGMYHAHHSGRTPRAKIRVREYVDSGQRYVEVKRRLNTERTTKSRIHLNGNASHALDLVRTLPDYAAAGLGAGAELREVLSVDYTRITLVRSTLTERVTVDVDLELRTPHRSVAYPGFAFFEVKQLRTGDSPFVDALRTVRAQRGSISKYCLGVVALVEHAKKNRFKQEVAKLHRLRTDRDLAHVA